MSKHSMFTKFLLITNVLTIVLLVWIWCKGPNCTNDPNKASKSLIVGSTSDPSPGTCPPNCYPMPMPCDTSNPFSTALAQKMIDCYRENHWKAANRNCAPFSNNPNISDARSVYFSLKTLKRFINTIETKSCKMPCSPQLELGIRIYYAEYPQAADIPADSRITPDLAGMHTLLMVPTYDVSADKHVDFDPNRLNDCNGNSVFDTTVAAIVLLAPEVSAQNHGGLAPPPSICDDYWNTSGALFMRYVDMASKDPSGASRQYGVGAGFTCPISR